MIHALRGVSALAIAATLAFGPANAATDRVAVVVGNYNYDVISDLPNAGADARAMAELLREMGFTVFEGYDVDRERFEQLMRQSMLNADDGAEIVFFYAGHGIQIGRRNYLLPADVAFSSVYDLPVESITLDRVIDVLSSRGNLHVAIIDSCRENPFPETQLAGDLDASLYETRQGFEIFRTPLNSLVAFSTTPGQVAYDGAPGGHSPYTAAIIDEVTGAPDQNVTDVLSRVRERVYSATEGLQVPWESSTLVQPFRFQIPEIVPAVDVQTIGEDQDPDENVYLATTPIPGSVTLQVEYNRAIDLGPALAAEVGADALTQLMSLGGTKPTNGSVAFTDSGPVFAPTLSERPSNSTDVTLSEQFSLATESGDEISVTLEMDVNACDLAAGDALDPGGVGFYRLPNQIPVAEALQACEAAVADNPSEPRFIYQLGRAQLAATQFEDAFVSFETAREMGYIRANYGQARLIVSGEIDRNLTAIPRDLDRGFTLLQVGIDAADPYAMHTRGGYLLLQGETDAERERGFELLERAAELGHTFSMNTLGIYFLTPETDHFIPERGLRYLQASAARNDIFGYHNLGIINNNGLIEGASAQAAYDWFVRAALGGHPWAPGDLGRMIVRGQVDADLTEAVRWYDMGLERGDPWAGANAAFLILDGQIDGLTAADGLVRSAKAVNLVGAEDAIQTAEQQIRNASDRDVGRAIQLLANELGADLTVDGAIGPATRQTLATLAAEAGVAEPSGNLGDILIGVGLIYRAENPIRSDVF